jgi:hypothetical protein
MYIIKHTQLLPNTRVRVHFADASIKVEYLNRFVVKNVVKIADRKCGQKTWTKRVDKRLDKYRVPAGMPSFLICHRNDYSSSHALPARYMDGTRLSTYHVYIIFSAPVGCWSSIFASPALELLTILIWIKPQEYKKGGTADRAVESNTNSLNLN